MTLTDPHVDLRAIRAYGGSQARAFEELAFQLLTPDIDRTRLRLTRTGDPDAGAEWYTTDLSTGVQEAWQAKYIYDIDSLLGGMTESVVAVCRKRPHVRRLTFVIPWNLPDGRRKGTKSARQKYEDKVATWKKEVDGASRLEFDLVDESALLDLLAQEDNRGRARFFFDKSILAHKHLRQHQEEAKIVAGRRYRPELQVDIPLQEQLEIAGKRGPFLESVQAELNRLQRDLERVQPLTGELRERSMEVIHSVERVFDASEDWSQDSAALTTRIAAISSALQDAVAAISRLREEVRNEDDRLKQAALEAGDDYPKQNQISVSERSYTLRSLAGPVALLLRSLEGPEANLFVGMPLLLTGDAGTGKTHLLLEAAQRALDDSRPFAVLFADQFGPGPVWPQLATQLGLSSSVSKGELLGALDSCGAAADTRFVLAIDALNETSDSTFWARALPELEAAIRSHPHVSLVVTVRSTYIDAVDPDHRRSSDFVSIRHPGLSGREHEATRLYFDHYKMEAPRYPLLTPEFSNPLFLQLYCETFQGNRQPPQGADSRIEVFDRLLERCLRNVAARTAGSGTNAARAIAEASARRVLDAILDELTRSGGETLPLEDAVAAARASTTEVDGNQILAELEGEGILSTAPMWFQEGPRRGVRATFQALADYLLLRRRWELENLDTGPDEAFVDWLQQASWGIQEAAAVWLPEKSGIELRALLDPDFEDEEAGSHLDRMTVDSLAFRSIDSITDATTDAINRCLQDEWTDPESVYSQLCAVAPIPQHPLNAERIHGHLLRHQMADRDADFGVAVYDVLEHDGPYLRLARWAQAGPYPDYSSEVVELATIPLVWLLTSPNRRMRDWITKVLVQLLAGHPDVARSMVGHFARCDDLYVRERLAAVVYGLLMRTDSHGSENEHRALVTEVIDRYLRSPTPHALMLDHIEGIVELALDRGLLGSDPDVPHIPPYGFRRPHHPWTMKHIEKDYGYHSMGSQDYDFSYSGIYGSLFSMGDFGRYQADSTFKRFTNWTLDSDPPQRPSGPEHILDEEQYERVLAEADPAVSSTLEAKLRELGEEEPSELTSLLVELTDGEERLLGAIQACWRWEREVAPADYPTESARRWIFMKAIQLGWTPDRFGHFESWRTRDDGRSANKAERFGKKYQWLAYFELLAKVRDNFHPKPGWASDTDLNEFPGLWNTFDRDIDPSVPPVDNYAELGDVNSDLDTTWKPVAVDVRIPAFETPALTRFVEDAASDALTDYDTYPRAEDVVAGLDQDGDQWLVLDCYHPEKVEDRSLEFGMSMDQATILHSWLAPLSTLEDTAQRLVDLGHRLREPHDSPLARGHGHTDCCYIGEMGWRDQGCYHRAIDPIPVDDEHQDLTLTPTVEDSCWEAGRYDSSITSSTVLSVPSAWVLTKSDLKWDGNLSWNDSAGRVTMVNIGRHNLDRTHAFAVRAEWLHSWLADNHLGLILRCWTERRDFRGSESRQFHELASVTALGADLSRRFVGESYGPY